MTYAIAGDWAAQGACIGSTARMEMPTTRSLNGTRAPSHLARHKVEAARTLCNTCPVHTQCRAWACTTPDPVDGMIAGGLTPRERDTVSAGATLELVEDAG